MTTLADLTTMRVGGPIRDLRRPTSRAALVDAARAAWASGETPLVLGGGSNVLADDSGYDGTVIVTTGVTGIEAVDDRGRLRVAAGESWDALVARAVALGLGGIEALSGIPGTVGAAPMQNIGAYGQELAATLVSVDLLDQSSGEERTVPAADLALGYRASALKGDLGGIVLGVELALRPGAEGMVAYDQLAAVLGVELGRSLPLAAIRDGVLAVRRAKGMVDDGVALPSVGSFFLNPIVSESFAGGLPAELPRHPSGGDGVKLSAAWLIEHAGIARGFALPGSRAAISPLHTLAIVNTGGATAADVLELAGYIQLRVAADFGVNLLPEPQILPSRPVAAE